jgi:hypothetical protein
MSCAFRPKSLVCGARVNAVSPGIIISPLARRRDVRPRRGELPEDGRDLRERACRHAGRGRGRRSLPPARTPGFVTGSDLLMDGGVIAALRAGRWSLTA